MQEKEEDKTMVPTLSDSEFFYNKLGDLLESFGLSLILNVRETTLLDLYLVYLEVTRRGGYKQVGEENKWCEVASALKLDFNSNANLSAQLQNLYFHLLYPFEKLYFYRSPSTQATISSTRGGTSQVSLLPPENVITTKDKQVGATPTNIVPEKRPKRRKHQPKVVKEGKPKRTTKPATSGAECVENNEKKMKKRVGAPLGQKNAYHIFLKQECARLKTCRQDLDRRKILSVAVDSWRNMSAIEKQPYVEESNKLKEKGKEVMMIEKKEESMEDRRKWEEKRSSSACLGITEEASKDKGSLIPS